MCWEESRKQGERGAGPQLLRAAWRSAETRDGSEGWAVSAAAPAAFWSRILAAGAGHRPTERCRRGHLVGITLQTSTDPAGSGDGGEDGGRRGSLRLPFPPRFDASPPVFPQAARNCLSLRWEPSAVGCWGKAKLLSQPRAPAGVRMRLASATQPKQCWSPASVPGHPEPPAAPRTACVWYGAGQGCAGGAGGPADSSPSLPRPWLCPPCTEPSTLQAGGQRVPGCARPFGEPPVKLCPVLGTASCFW